MADATFSRFPDVWYDVYVRLIPGSLLLSATLFKFDKFPALSSLSGGIWLLLVGFALGHVLQPMFSRLTWLLETVTKARQKKEEVRNKIASSSRENLLLSKQYAETVGMLALSVVCLLSIISDEIVALSLALPAIDGQKADVAIHNRVFWISAAFFLCLAVERSLAAKRRCVLYQSNVT